MAQRDDDENHQTRRLRHLVQSAGKVGGNFDWKSIVSLAEELHHTRAEDDEREWRIDPILPRAVDDRAAHAPVEDGLAGGQDEELGDEGAASLVDDRIGEYMTYESRSISREIQDTLSWGGGYDTDDLLGDTEDLPPSRVPTFDIKGKFMNYESKGSDEEVDTQNSSAPSGSEAEALHPHKRDLRRKFAILFVLLLVFDAIILAVYFSRGKGHESANVASPNVIDDVPTGLEEPSQHAHPKKHHDHPKKDHSHKPVPSGVHTHPKKDHPERHPSTSGGDPESNTSCSFCPGGIPNPDLVLPTKDGTKCGLASEYAATLSFEDPKCPTVQLAEPYCCPDNPVDAAAVDATSTDDSAADTLEATDNVDLESEAVCEFCPSGIPDPDLVLPTKDGTKCGTASAYAATLSSDDPNCTTTQLAQPYCCPVISGESGATGEAISPDDSATDTLEATNNVHLESEAVCEFCPEGIPDPDLALPTEHGTKCGTASAYAATLTSDDPNCPTAQLAQPYCCPTKRAESATDSLHLESRTMLSTRKSRPNGATTELVVEGDESASYVDFDLSFLAKEAVTRATLNLHVTKQSEDLDDMTVNVDALSNGGDLKALFPWSDSLGSQEWIRVRSFPVEPLASGDEGRLHAVDVTSAIDAASERVTFKLSTESNGWLHFANEDWNEGEEAPELVIQYST